MNNLSKIIGWLVFFAGLFIIVFALWSSYNIFTAKAEVPAFFQMPAEQNSSSKAGAQTLEGQLQKMLSDQIKGLVPTDFIGKILNLTVWTMLAFILMSGGSKIAGLGIKLLKNEKKDERV